MAEFGLLCLCCAMAVGIIYTADTMNEKRNEKEDNEDKDN